MEGKWNEMLWTRDKIRLYATLKRTDARIQVIFDDLIKIMETFRFEAKNDYENEIWLRHPRKLHYPKSYHCTSGAPAVHVIFTERGYALCLPIAKW